MKYFSVLDITSKTDEWIPDYLPTANKLVAKHGGKYLTCTAFRRQVEEDTQKTALCIIIERPSKENAMNFMEDPDYKPHLLARTTGSISHHYLIAAQDDLW